MRFEAVEFDFEVFDVALFSFAECALAGREKGLAEVWCLRGAERERERRRDRD